MFDPMASLPAWHRDRIAADEAREAREFEAEQAERADRADTMARMAEAAERMTIYRTGHSSAELREAASNAATAREMRNYQGEWGSAQRAAVIVTGAGGVPVTLQPRELASGPVTMPRDAIEAQLARAREVKRSATVLGMVAELERRERGGRPAISRSADPGGAVDCTHCIEVGASPAESYLLHSDPDLPPLPYGRVPDHPPERARRVGSGTGWPEIVR